MDERNDTHTEHLGDGKREGETCLCGQPSSHKFQSVLLCDELHRRSKIQRADEGLLQRALRVVFGKYGQTTRVQENSCPNKEEVTKQAIRKMGLWGYCSNGFSE